MGEMVTFHSSKGGAGRTMALANVATLLARWGYKTLVMDWDLEVAGLWQFFQRYASQPLEERPGVLDLLTQRQDGSMFTFAEPDWESLSNRIRVGGDGTHLDFISAGALDANYVEKLRKLDLGEFYRNRGGYVIERLREQWKAAYDFVIIDSRSGITDVSGVATIQLADILVACFTASEHSLRGAVDIVARSSKGRARLPVERAVLRTVPVLSRVDAQNAPGLFRDWLSHSAHVVGDLYANWLPASVDVSRFLELTLIPYSPRYSFGEHLPVVEESVDAANPLSFAYAVLAGLLARGLESPEELLANREEFVRTSTRAARAEARAEAQKKKAAEASRTKPRIFLSYAREDLERVEKIYEGLMRRGLNVWFDKVNLRTGPWKSQVEKAIAQSRYFIICLSRDALRKLGDDPAFQDEEIEEAFAIARLQSKRDFTIVPVRLEDCERGDHRLSIYQQYDLFPDLETRLNLLADALT